MYAEVKSTAVASNPIYILTATPRREPGASPDGWEAQRAAHRPAVADGKATKPLR